MATVSTVTLTFVGKSGPTLTGPRAVETKKLTTDPGVKPEPFMEKLAPTMTTLLGPKKGMKRKFIKGCPGAGLGLAVGSGVWVAVGVGVGVRVGLGVVVMSGVGLVVASGVGVGVAITPIPLKDTFRGPLVSLS